MILNCQFNDNFTVSKNVAIFTCGKGKNNVASRFWMQEHLTLERFIHVEHDRKWFVVNDDGFGRVNTEGLVRTHNDCNDVTHKTNSVFGDIWKRNSSVHHRIRRRCWIQIDVIGCPYMQNTRHGTRFIRIDAK